MVSVCVCVRARVWILNYKKSDSINQRGESALDSAKLSAPADGARPENGPFPGAAAAVDDF